MSAAREHEISMNNLTASHEKRHKLALSLLRKAAKFAPRDRIVKRICGLLFCSRGMRKV